MHLMSKKKNNNNVESRRPNFLFFQHFEDQIKSSCILFFLPYFLRPYLFLAFSWFKEVIFHICVYTQQYLNINHVMSRTKNHVKILGNLH